MERLHCLVSTYSSCLSCVCVCGDIYRQRCVSWLLSKSSISLKRLLPFRCPQLRHTNRHNHRLSNRSNRLVDQNKSRIHRPYPDYILIPFCSLTPLVLALKKEIGIKIEKWRIVKCRNTIYECGTCHLKPGCVNIYIYVHRRLNIYH